MMHINFNFKILIKLLGLLTMVEGIAMIPCVMSALYFNESAAGSALMTTSLVCVCAGFVLLILLKFNGLSLKQNEGYLIASISWVFCSIIGALPYYFSGNDYPLVSCFFESVAGFSTTGCSVLDMNLMPKALLLWKAVSHWLGGMGILVLVISIFPALGISGQSIAVAEAPGPTLEKFGTKISETGKYLYRIYITLTLAEYILLLAGSMDWFDALITTFSSISTGGLIVTEQNVALFSSTYNRFVILIFTFLSSLNFVIYFAAIKGRWREAIRNVEARAFVCIILVSTFFISMSLWLSKTYSSLWQAIKDSLCQVVSFISTSGYYVCDYTKWPTFTLVILFTLLFIGGCSFSTSGSLKVIRAITFAKLIKRGMFKQIHPLSVKAVFIDGKPLPANKASAITTHILLYFAFFMFSCVVLSLNGLDLETTITTSIGIFSNSGLAAGAVGCTSDFSIFNHFSQFYMCIMMISGRLEMYAVILLFSRSFWNTDRAKTI